MERSWKNASRKKWLDPKHLQESVSKLREQDKSIVTINGSFDLMHSGHLEILYRASLQGDLLIVALNSDESVRSYKGENKPIVPLENRLEMVSAISFVNYVTWFDESDPRELLTKIKPDVHVNGSEYGHECIEAEVVAKQGGRLYIMERIEGLSTTNIIEKIVSCVS